MKLLADELLTRFPEIRVDVHEGDEDLPYLMVSYLVDWLETKCSGGCDETVVRRLVEFWDWCKDQPEGKSASDDINTIVVVSLHEKLFEHPSLRYLIPKLMTKEEVTINREYLMSWVGKENYEKVLEYF